MNRAKKKEPRRALKLGALTLGSAAVILAVLNLIPPKQNAEQNPFRVSEGTLPMIAAHRGGAANFPENTLLAYRAAVEQAGAQIIESDLYLTADGILVCNHNPDIDETSNVNGDVPLESVLLQSKRHVISDMTLAQLRQYNFGFYFENAEGERPYQDAQLPIPTLQDLFSAFYDTHPDLLFILEIKDGGERGVEACRKLDELLAQFPLYADNIVIGTFHDEIEQELRENYPSLLRGASEGPAASFILTQFARVNLFDRGDFACLQIPTSYDVGAEIGLKRKTLVERAHRRNIAVQYWTVNDEAEMRELIALGCDCIITDDPLLLSRVLEDYK